ncbi:MAG: 3-oxoadipate CoA-transferase [Alphaproteobacteria bacterium]|nr:3-oxoadipate CoA-transferase [Alphaproteobacteria bacterium]|tara:strand:- start:698 stop:1414 length:717 start_codon:yes stop_codon:yes gene_type:complete
MMNKITGSLDEAIADIHDGAVIHVGGFGLAGSPIDLLHALADKGTRDLTIVSNNAGVGRVGIARLLYNGQVRKIVCSFPRQQNSTVIDDLHREGKIELELVPQGTLAERIRAAGAGVGGFYTPTSVGTPLAEGKEHRVIDGKEYVLELPIHADFALIKAERGDRWGNLVYHKAQRNFGPPMCMAADTTIVQVRHVVDLGELDPEAIATPSIFVDRVVEVPDPLSERVLVAEEEKQANA